MLMTELKNIKIMYRNNDDNFFSRTGKYLQNKNIKINEISTVDYYYYY